jgi:hypothetical protein
MLTDTNTSPSNLIIQETLSSSVVRLEYESESYFIPQIGTNLEYPEEIAEWKDRAFNESDYYNFQDEDVAKIDTLISFTKNLLENSIDIENEFVDIVNDNFWDLI